MVPECEAPQEVPVWTAQGPVSERKRTRIVIALSRGVEAFCRVEGLPA